MDADQSYSEMAKKTIECPVCGISVKVENVEAHLRRVHPGKEVDIDELDIPKVKKPKKARTAPGVGTWKKWVAAIAICVVVVLVAVVLMLPPPEEEEPNYAPNFVVNDVYGQRFSLNEEIGDQPILIQFFDPEGEACKDEIPHLTNLSAHFGSDLKMISLSYRIDDEVRYFREYYGADWIFAHASQDIRDDYGVSGHPYFVLVDKKGVIKFEFEGRISLEDLIDIIDPYI